MTPEHLKAIHKLTGMSGPRLSCVLGLSPMTVWRWERAVGDKNHRPIHDLYAEGVVAIVNRVMPALRKNWKPLEISDYASEDCTQV